MEKLNPFVYETISAHGMPKPDIPVKLYPTYSQCYEDIIIDSILQAHKRLYGNQDFVFVEIGANHPVATSSSYLFRVKYQMPTILVEANPKLISALEQFRAGDVVINRAVVDNDQTEIDFFISKNNETSSLDSDFVNIRTPGIVEKITVPTIRINQILEAIGAAKKHIILSIDVEAYDLPILKDIDFDQFRPYLILIEPSEDYQPGSIRNIVSFMQEKNYALVAETPVNLLFKTNI